MKFATWNMLSSGLSGAEFITPTGDKHCSDWAVRGPKVLKVLRELIGSCGLVAMQEVDVFFWLLGEIRKTRPEVHAVWVIPSKYSDTPDPKNEAFLLASSPATKRTFASEHSPENFARSRLHAHNLGGFSPGSAPYHAPHGIALFWNSSKLSISGALSPVNWQSWGEAPHMSYGYSPQRHFVASFTVLATQKELVVATAHLKSGTSKAPERASHLSTILDTIDRYNAPRSDSVLLMDSNYDSCESCDALIRQRAYSSVGMELPSFKMRSVRSAQPEKAGLLKVTCVDKILVPRSTSLHWQAVHCSEVSSFHLPPLRHVTCLKHLATSAQASLSDLAREPGFRESIAQGHLADKDAVERLSSVLPIHCTPLQPAEVILESLMSLQPNPEAPSDHVPIAAEWSSA